ncbi:hypothetical protein GGQ80_001139 [Sphingomonas jinjuensis]|uniref:Uncharacterized protein n=1 Tax=Sphingomonas jinjuensis TaxID=535907 RepID=A0A840F9H7_9SPHN|nr:hypothetical protein [Sphingomonas jinjuensis]MBB4153251.1 hypothetical protein [Sphingomonas jinjuensis]
MERTITLRRAGIGYAVTVTPPLPGFDFDLEDERELFVRGYVRSLSRHHGWAVRDETAEGGND